MATAENLLFMPPDEEISGFLQAEQLTDVVDDGDRIALDVWLDRRLFVLSAIADEIDHNNQVAQRRIAMIREATDEQNAVLQRRAAYLESLLAQMAMAYPYPKGKTRKLPFGEIGIRTQKPKLVVDDADAVIAWAKESNTPEFIRVKEEVAKTELNAYVESTGLDVPGTRIEPGCEKPFVRVKKEVA